MLKSICYAYPTSTMAEKLNRYNDGCYFIEFTECESKPAKSFYPIAFSDLKECDRVARDMHWAAFSRYSRRYC